MAFALSGPIISQTSELEKQHKEGKSRYQAQICLLMSWEMSLEHEKDSELGEYEYKLG